MILLFFRKNDFQILFHIIQIKLNSIKDQQYQAKIKKSILHMYIQTKFISFNQFYLVFQLCVYFYFIFVYFISFLSGFSLFVCLCVFFYVFVCLCISFCFILFFNQFFNFFILFVYFILIQFIYFFLMKILSLLFVDFSSQWPKLKKYFIQKRWNGFLTAALTRWRVEQLDSVFRFLVFSLRIIFMPFFSNQQEACWTGWSDLKTFPCLQKTRKNQSQLQVFPALTHYLGYYQRLLTLAFLSQQFRELKIHKIYFFIKKKNENQACLFLFSLRLQQTGRYVVTSNLSVASPQPSRPRISLVDFFRFIGLYIDQG
ncbi:transmembrane protein, putative (macronuclear) [Tetrahymena thermophila SB210]|uniref:Transmembrane protein, putative n=1 Tax=Tetrahymena thermophila (strain SB210) TaxID=312017 RepID=W7XIJ5_TETTS|nr:transmembrane protein, putative [Tetrahymena thermophila SB210]EWS74706.1 transmembrane protein, putative [Tetrahymena thermophila SB210]|eukprot:XP_012652707.1 transmembrane protein, putative [Tetrahymena thermophila SB210]